MADITKEASMFDCKCGNNTKAAFYCIKNCNPASYYFCLMCDQIHDHKYTKIAEENTKNYNICLTAKSYIQELFQNISKKEAQYQELLKVMVEASKLANYEDRPHKEKLIHQDLEEFKKLKKNFDNLFSRAE